MKLLKNITALIIAIALTSCTFTEEITLNPDGSGNYKLNTDMSALMAFSEMEDSISDGVKEKHDTLIYVKDIFEELRNQNGELTEEQQGIFEAVKNMTVHIKQDDEEGIFFMDFLLDFKALTELDNMNEKIQDIQNLQKNEMTGNLNVNNNKVSYSYDGNSFKRKVEMLKLTDEEQRMFDENMEQAAMILGSSTYRIKYNFPKSIKKTTLKEATISEDGKTLIFEIPFDSIAKRPDLLDFEVQF